MAMVVYSAYHYHAWMTLIAVKDVETPWSRLADTQHVTSFPVRGRIKT